MRKQVDFVVRVWALGNGNNDTVTTEKLSKEIREIYLDNGYEVFSTHAIQVAASAVFYNVTFVKYEYVPELLVDEAKTVDVSAKSK